MPTITAGASTAITVAVGTYLEGTGAGMAVLGPAAVVEPLTAGDAWQIGPFDRSTVVNISAASAITYTVKDNMRDPSDADRLSPATVAAILAALPVTSTWANRAALVAAGQTTAFFTDVGVGGGSVWTYSGSRWRPYAGQVVLKNLTASVTQTTNTRAVMDFCTLLPGLWQDGDILECRWYKAMTTGTDTDTTESAIGTGSGTFGTSLGLSTAALTNTNPVLSAIWRWRRVSNTTLRHASIGGATGLGSAGALLNDITASVPDMDGITTYPQLSGVLTTGAGAVSALRACTWTLIAGA